MTKTRFSILILAVLTALCLVGCVSSDDSQVESSVEEGIQTFGVEVNPSAQPSTGQVIPQVSTAVTDDTTVSSGNVTTGEQEVEAAPEVTAEPSPSPSTSTSTSTPKPSSSVTASDATPSPETSTTPTIAPPAPVSSATADDVMKYVGQSLNSLIEDWGYPSSSGYEYVDEEDPSQGEIGTFYYSDFTVTTLRTDAGETITGVVTKPSSAATPSEPTTEAPTTEEPTTEE